MSAHILSLSIIAGVLFGCQPSGTIVLTLDSEDPIALTSDQEVTISIYGFDRNYADTSATLLLQLTFAVPALPLELRIPYQDAWLKDIEPNSGREEDYGFYLAMGPEEGRQGELVLDFNANDFDQYFKSRLEELSGLWYIKRE
jgi:hypothetical protein